MKDTLPEILGSAEPGGGAEEDAEDEVPGTLAEWGQVGAEEGEDDLGGEEEVHYGGAEES